MDFELTADQWAWREEIRSFLTDHVTPELLHELLHLGAEARGPELRAFRSKVGERGWYGLAWPVEFGGLGRGPVDQHILQTEFLYASSLGGGAGWGCHDAALCARLVGWLTLRGQGV